MLKRFQTFPDKANSLLLALLLVAPVIQAQDQASEQVKAQAQAAASADSELVRPPLLVVAQAGGESAPLDEDQTPAFWLNKMAEAVTSLEYRGLVTFEHVGMLETLEVVRGIRGGELVERVRYLSGTSRELVSRGHDAHCRREGSPLSRAGIWSRSGQQNVQALYHVLLRGDERVADRDAVVLELRPKDMHRLGMMVSVDKETGLPLKSLLVNANGQILERYQFVQLDLSPVDDSALVAQTDSARKSETMAACGSIVSRWDLRWVPPGFKAVAAREVEDGEMLVYSDGLSVFTVFIQSLGPEMNFNGRAVRGATVAYMDHILVGEQRYTITVVGEIPVQTAQLVARGIAAKN
ncbi:MucB/RseB C-terminal domain-containing protein [Microbulbifer aggregans]|uniref:MucB/RseB C-terminal domain-containing protein n=1 Tax=Microbulbifer aggregans TaxID=1769779 RepID=UPI001CFD04BE|nr:MucB/RseB C-terminal domain-containing protein [Microbulbifer aggregans]